MRTDQVEKNKLYMVLPNFELIRVRRKRKSLKKEPHSTLLCYKKGSKASPMASRHLPHGRYAFVVASPHVILKAISVPEYDKRTGWLVHYNKDNRVLALLGEELVRVENTAWRYITECTKEG